MMKEGEDLPPTASKLLRAHLEELIPSGYGYDTSKAANDNELDVSARDDRITQHLEQDMHGLGKQIQR